MYSTWKTKVCSNHIRFLNLVEDRWFDSKLDDPNIQRLGGFHLSKSYLAIFGVIFTDSGLYDITKLIYEGELAAGGMLKSNSYDKAIRAYLLIHEAILQHVILASAFTDNDLSLMKTIKLDCSKNHARICSRDIPMACLIPSKSFFALNT